MRNPENERDLNQLENVLVAKLDVLDLDSIQTALMMGVQKFGSVDVHLIMQVTDRWKHLVEKKLYDNSTMLLDFRCYQNRFTSF
jgi:hypothetical protein